MPTVSLSNSKDIIADSISIVKGNQVIDVLDTINAVQGLAPETVNSLEQLANALDNNPTFYSNVAQAIEQKADTTYVNSQLSTKANQATTYTKTENDTLLSSKAMTVDVNYSISYKSQPINDIHKNGKRYIT